MFHPPNASSVLQRLAKALGVDPASCPNIRLSFPANELAQMSAHRTLTDAEIERFTTCPLDELDAYCYQVIEKAHYSLVPKPREEA